MKKFVSLLCFLFFFGILFSFSSCSNSVEDKTDTETENSEKASQGKTDGEDTKTEQSVLRNFAITVLIDDEIIRENIILENENTRNLSFSYSDSETGDTGELPTVKAKWEIVSGADYVYFDTNKANSVQITNINYSTSVQSISLKLTITPESKTYAAATVTINLKAGVLAKKDISAAILYNGEKISETPILKSATDGILSCSLNDSVTTNTKWEVISGENYVVALVSDGCLKISNLNCSGENKEISLKLTLTTNNIKYNTTSYTTKLIVEDSTEILLPGAFTTSINLGTDSSSNYDGTIKISWTESKNATDYYIYRNKKMIAHITQALEYIDKDYGFDSSIYV